MVRIHATLILLAGLLACSKPADRPSFKRDVSCEGQDCKPDDPKVGGDNAAAVEGATTPKRLWRLTTEQFANTLNSLLGRATDVEAKFDTDTRPQSGFGNEASQLGISSIFASNLESAITPVLKDALPDLEKQPSCGKASAINEDCLAAFVKSFGLRAFRRPLTEEETTRYQTVYTSVQKTLGNSEGLLAVAEAILRSPYTQFRSELGEAENSGTAALDPYETATALAFALTNSPPDRVLMELAGNGEILKEDVYKKQVDRLLASEGFEQGLTQFLFRWSGVRWLPHVQKNKAMFPQYTTELSGAMAEEAKAFVKTLVKDDKASFVALLTSNKSTITPPLKEIYGGDAFTGSKTITLKKEERSGLLTLPGVIAANSSANQTGPIHRDVFLLTKLMCQAMPPPPPDASTVLPETDPTLTLRERFKAHSTDPSCSVCHNRLDPYGFSMEIFDPIGRFRTMDNGKPVDASGTIVGTSDSNNNFNSAIDMLDMLSKSQDVHACFVKNVFRYTFGRGETPADDDLLDTAQKNFAASGYDMRTIFATFTNSESFKLRKEVP